MTPATGNLFAPAGVGGDDEHVETLVGAPAVRIERIVSRGHASPPGFWYDQAEHEWVAVLEGAARLELRDPAETVALGSGDHLLIPARRPHRVAWTAPDEETVWLAVFYAADAGDGGAGDEVEESARHGPRDDDRREVGAA